MLVGYVSDQDYYALPGAMLLFKRDGRSVEGHADAEGAVHAELEPGEYEVVLQAAGHVGKRVRHTLGGEPIQFRLLRDRLIGYSWPLWCCSGDAIEPRVHCSHEYTLSLHRYGAKKELVRKLGVVSEHGRSPNVQHLPDRHFVHGGLEWDNQIRRMHKIFVAAPERSGLYYFHAKAKNGEFFSFPVVVAPRTPRARIAVLASTNTWCAYNEFGGRGNYIFPIRKNPYPTVDARADMPRYARLDVSETEAYGPGAEPLPLSFKRPIPFCHVPEEMEATDPITGRDECHTAPAEWRLLAWLEREGFGYDLYSEYQLHDGSMPIAAYDLVIVSTHAEYYTREMYQTLKRYVSEGGRMMVLSGNTIGRRVELLDEATMRFVNMDWRYDEMFGEDPAALLGSSTDVEGLMTGAPYVVLEPDHWAFAGLGFQKGDEFGHACLQERCPWGASGHEMDTIRPASPPQLQHIAKGANRKTPDGPMCGGDMTYYENDAGGAVFGVGSVTYIASLLVDEPLSRITRNVVGHLLGRK